MFKFLCRQTLLFLLGEFLGAELAGSRSDSPLNYLRKRQTIFHTIVQPHPQCIKVPASLQPHQHFSYLSFLMVAILMGVNWCFIVLLTLCVCFWFEFLS